ANRAAAVAKVVEADRDGATVVEIAADIETASDRVERLGIDVDGTGHRQASGKRDGVAELNLKVASYARQTGKCTVVRNIGGIGDKRRSANNQSAAGSNISD